MLVARSKGSAGAPRLFEERIQSSVVCIRANSRHTSRDTSTAEAVQCAAQEAFGERLRAQELLAVCGYIYVPGIRYAPGMTLRVLLLSAAPGTSRGYDGVCNLYKPSLVLYHSSRVCGSHGTGHTVTGHKSQGAWWFGRTARTYEYSCTLPPPIPQLCVAAAAAAAAVAGEQPGRYPTHPSRGIQLAACKISAERNSPFAGTLHQYLKLVIQP